MVLRPLNRCLHLGSCSFFPPAIQLKRQKSQSKLCIKDLIFLWWRQKKSHLNKRTKMAASLNWIGAAAHLTWYTLTVPSQQLSTMVVTENYVNEMHKSLSDKKAIEWVWGLCMLSPGTARKIINNFFLKHTKGYFSGFLSLLFRQPSVAIDSTWKSTSITTIHPRISVTFISFFSIKVDLHLCGILVANWNHF